MKKQTPRDIKIRVSMVYLAIINLKTFCNRYQHLRKDFTQRGWGKEFKDNNIVGSIWWLVLQGLHISSSGHIQEDVGI